MIKVGDKLEYPGERDVENEVKSRKGASTVASHGGHGWEVSLISSQVLQSGQRKLKTEPGPWV